MRAAGFQCWGGLEVVEIIELPKPEPGAGQVRIRVAAATVNPGDVELRAGAIAAMLGDATPPFLAGMEVAGTIDAVGSGAGPWQAGQRVAAIVSFLGDGRGGHAEWVVVPAASVVAVPPGLSLVEAATIPMNGLTARICIERLALAPGATVAITGAAGAVGGYAIQIARAAGMRVIAMGAPSDEELLLGLGATAIVPRDGDPAAELAAVAPDGVDGLIDAARLRAAVVPAVRDGGRVAALFPYGDATERGIALEEVLVLQHIDDTAGLEAVMRLAGDGGLQPRVARTFALDRAADAYRTLEAGGVRGRVVLDLTG